MSYTFTPTPGTIYFVGAGPGAPDLITVRGQDIIAQADLILYADSLVAESVADLAHKSDAKIQGSSGMHLEQMLALMVESAQNGQVVARIHSGDPALYGAIHEQMAYLEDYSIPYEIIPGVTAAFAAAAELKTELTVPDVVQTIILTRTAGRTTMPQGEELRALAAPGASLAIYLSVSRIRHVIDDLLASGGYGPDTPVAVLHKVTWPDESIVTGTLADIADKVREAGYTKHALILVSPALDQTLKGANRRTSSHLYDKSYTHRFRRAEDFQRGKERGEAKGEVSGVVAGEKHLGSTPTRKGSVVIAVTRQGSKLAVQLADTLKAELSLPEKFNTDQSKIQNLKSKIYSDSALAEIRRRWPTYANLILVMPTGVAVRAIAPLLGHKSTDPAIICLDEIGQSVIPLLGGHQAGANALAQQIAQITGGHAAITTASDVQGKPALDLPPSNSPQRGEDSFASPPLGGNEGGQNRQWHIHPNSALTHAAAALVNNEPMGVYIDPALPESVTQQAQSWLAQVDTMTWVNAIDDLDLDAYTAGLIITHRPLSDHHRHLLQKCVLYRPQVLVVGMGCKKDVPADELREAFDTALAEAGFAVESVSALATVDLKATEPGLIDLADTLNVPLQIIPAAELIVAFPTNGREQLSPSAAQEKFDLPGVSEPCALLVAGEGSRLLTPKRSFERCTVAIALQGVTE